MFSTDAMLSLNLYLFISHFIESWIFPIVLFCSPVIFSTVSLYLITLISRVGCISKTQNITLLSKHHFEVFLWIYSHILINVSHSFNSQLSHAITSGRTRQWYLHLHNQTNALRNHFIHYLSRCQLTKPQKKTIFCIIF